MKNLFAYDFITNTYYASKTTLKKASNPNSAEYKALMKLMSQNPKASVAEKYIKPAIGKDNHKGLTKKFIEAYISIQSNAEDLRLQYENATRMGKFSFLRKWLFDVFPDFNMETAREEIEKSKIAEIKSISAEQKEKVVPMPEKNRA